MNMKQTDNNYKVKPLQLFSNISFNLNCIKICSFNTKKNLRLDTKNYILYYNNNEFKNLIKDFKYLKELKKKQIILKIKYNKIKKSKTILNKTILIEI